MALVNSVQASSDGSDTTIASPAFAATTGNLIVVFFRQTGNLNLPSSVADTAGNTYIGNGQADISGVGGDALTHYYAYNITGNASNVVTLTWSPSAQLFRAITVFEFDNIDYSSGDPLDQVVVTRQSAASSITSGTFTTLQDNEVICAGVGTGSLTANYTEDTGYLPSPPLTVTSKDAASEYKIVSTTQTGVTTSMSADVTTNWAMVVATFRTLAVANRFFLLNEHPPPMIPLRIFIGYDSKEPVAFATLVHSILARATVPVSITPLTQSALRASGLYTRERGPLESTEFSMTRFLVPHLCDYQGYAVFMDCDMLCRVDVAEIWDVIYAACPKPLSAYHQANYILDKAVLVCYHDYAPKTATKFLGQPQTAYPRKNWSSFIIFNNARCRALTPEYVNTASGLDLHRFNWLRDNQIGSLPLEWNWLVGADNQSTTPPKFIHYTTGGPYFPEYADCEQADEWRAEFAAMTAPLPL